MEAETMNKKFTTAKQTIEIGALLTAHITQLGEGRCEYQGNWNDERIANETGAAKSAVQRIRRELYGDIRAKKGEGTDPRGQRMRDVEERLDKLEEFLQDLGFKAK